MGGFTYSEVYVTVHKLTVCNSTNEITAAINATATLCDRPPANHYVQLPVGIGIMAAIPTLLIILRLALKLAKVSSWYHDDTTIILAWVSMIDDVLLPNSWRDVVGEK